MKFYNLVLCCTLFTATLAFTLPDVFQNYRKGDQSEISESSACECKNGRCVTDNRGKTKCNCPPKFALQGETVCEKCDCGSMGKCIFMPHAKSAGSVSYEKKCLCDVGSAEKDGLCVDCHCGENSKCEFEDDEKICYCIEDYAEKDGVCTECNCGFFGQCSFRNGEKICECDENYLVLNGVCELDLCIETCGVSHDDTAGNVVCEGGPFGDVRCRCKDQEEAFNKLSKSCEKCDCGEQSNGCEFEGERKICYCSLGYKQKFDVCHECDCGEHSVGCDFQGENKLCHCPEGYVQKGDVCGVKCGTDRKCQNGGYCDGGTCICHPGTVGEFCEIISDCDHLCPKYTNINCSYDIKEEKAYCQCLIPGMDYHPEMKDCRTTCREDQWDCKNGGKCLDVGRSKFCSCLEGTEGDWCEQIMECRELNCGDIAQCVFEVEERKAVCKCLINPHLTFDPLDLKCKVTEDVCKELKPVCLSTGGLCRPSDAYEVVCVCPENSVYSYRKGCMVNDGKCGTLFPKCEETGGKCEVQQNGTIHCSCPEDSGYGTDKGCRVNDGKCETLFPKCEETGGKCEVQQNGAIHCSCPEHTGYGTDRGCQVNDGKCRTLFPKCEETGGKCEVQQNGAIHCSCPEHSGYGTDIGCRVPDEECSNLKPKCLETKGVCELMFDSFHVQCQCPEDFAYEENEGCKGICRSSSDCMHGGICIEGENKFCECLEGTVGDLCQEVPDCYSMECGYDAKCVYSIWRRAAVCQCLDDQFGFDLETKKCKRTCAHPSDCLNGGTCVESKFSGYKFCECLKGTEGDLCEKIPHCDTVDCGSEAKCIFDVKEKKAVCVCSEETLSFDLVDRKCKKSCSTNGGCENGGECVMWDSHNSYCKCREGTSGDMCEVINECLPGSGRCKGDDSTCVYDINKGKAVCVCNSEDKKYDALSEGCKLTCTTDTGCKNGGLCMNRGSDDLFCICKEGISGDLCERVDLCQEKCGDGDDVVCKYDVDAETAVCECKDAKSVFDAATKSCKPCDCGGKEISCEVEDGKVICVCPEGFAEVDGKCKKQRCTEKKCSHGICEVIFDEEICSCYEGYMPDGDECIKIHCMNTACLNGTCIVRQGGIEECICPAGYTLRGDICIRGDCKMDTCYGGRCQIVDGELICVCPEKYHVEGIGCYETVCKIQRCFGGKCIVENDEEICTCPDGHIQENDVCKKILCEKKNCFGGKCHITDGVEECTCPDGYSIFEDVCRRNN